MNLRRMSPLRPWSCAARVVAALAALGVVTVAGCSAIFNPENSDDVIRCDNTIDCEQNEVIAEAISSRRVQAQCNAPGEGDGDFAASNPNKVCSVADADIGCNPESYMSQPYGMLFDEAANSSGVYVPCAEENRGTRGCRPRLDGGGCDGSLVVNDFGTCDEAGSGFPAIAPSPELRGFDVRDQFCRSFFCNENFVCDTSRSEVLCRECDPSKPIGEGGCAQLYFNGAPSPVYADPGANCPAVADTTNLDLGSLPTAP